MSSCRKVIIPGVIDSTSNFVEHPELMVGRIVRYANVVGRERMLAGVECVAPSPGESRWIPRSCGSSSRR
jgi:methionine synthase II (cobalamin-independent)